MGKATAFRSRLPAHGRDGSLGNAQRPVRNHQIHIKFHTVAQPQTDRTGSEWVIKGEYPRLDFIQADATVRT